MNLNSPNLNPYGNELLTFEKEINIRDQRTIYNILSRYETVCERIKVLTCSNCTP